MKNFFKIIASVAAVLAAAFGVLILIDKLTNKNRIEGDYLECDCSDDCDGDLVEAEAAE